MFKNRKEAGELLAKALSKIIDSSRGSEYIVVALPRGGVPVAKQIADSLGAKLDIFFVKKIPSPFNRETAIGAVSENGYFFVDSRAQKILGVDEEYIQNSIKEILNNIEKKRALYNKKRGSYKNKSVIVVDDGVATGSSMILAVDALKKEGAKEVIVATPVAPIEVANILKKVADEAIILETPINFRAVGEFYFDFHQLSDDEVMSLLNS